MSLTYVNQRGRTINLVEESITVGSMVTDALIYAKILAHDDDDSSLKLVANNFLNYRSTAAILSDNDVKTYAVNLAQTIINQLIERHLVNFSDKELALEITSEEIMARAAIETV